jgi:amphi-Trp domain-containing protein
MADRDVEKIKSRAKFVATLRRVADAVESQAPVRMQVAGKRFSIPVGATLSVEHEVEGNVEEVELQLRWQTEDGGSPPPSAAKPRVRKAARKPARRTR